MRTVVIYKLDRSLNTVEVGRVVLQSDGQAKLVGFAESSPTKKRLEEEGIPAWPNYRRRIRLTEGEQFLNSLPNELHGSRIWAVEVPQ